MEGSEDMLENLEFAVGDNMTIQERVKEIHTGMEYGTGMLGELLATPGVIAFMIKASVELIDAKLPEGYISVATMVHAEHFKPTLIGEVVSVKVTINSFDGARVKMDMEAFDEIGLVSKGRMDRYIVSEKSLMKKAKERAKFLVGKDY
jgi:predicted thioesterase